jgi:iron complex transport system substrate-binding protein
VKTVGSARQIDEQVQKIVRESLSVYRVRTDQLQKLKPDVILTQEHCEVCAVSSKDVEDAVCSLVGSKPRIVTLRPDALPDVWKGMLEVAQTLDHLEKGKTLIEGFKRRMDEISKQARALNYHPTVVLIEWFDPLMAAANWMPEFVERLGGKNLFGKTGNHALKIQWEEIRSADPEIIVIMPCGWSIERSLGEIETLSGKPGWNDLRAVREKRVYIADGSHYFNRPGPRLVDSFEMLAEMMHPGAFQFGRQGRGWWALDE